MIEASHDYHDARDNTMESLPYSSASVPFS